MADPFTFGPQLIGIAASCTCQIFEQGGEYGFKPYGSGVFVYGYGKHFLFTASHVVEAIRNHKLFFRTNEGFFAIEGFIVGTDYKFKKDDDVAFVVLEEALIPIIKKTYIFLPEHLVDPSHIPKPENTYLTYGYPTINIKVEDKMVSAIPQSTLHKISKDKVYKYYKYSPEDFYIIDQKGKGWNLVSDRTEDVITDPYGMSGSGLWLIGNHVGPRGIEFHHKLIGIMTKFIKGKYLVLVACNIHRITDYIAANNGDLKQGLVSIDIVNQ